MPAVSYWGCSATNYLLHMVVARSGFVVGLSSWQITVSCSCCFSGLLVCVSRHPHEGLDLWSSVGHLRGFNAGTHIWHHFWCPFLVPFLVPIFGTIFGTHFWYHFRYPFLVPFSEPIFGTIFGTYFWHHFW